MKPLGSTLVEILSAYGNGLLGVAGYIVLWAILFRVALTTRARQRLTETSPRTRWIAGLVLLAFAMAWAWHLRSLFDDAYISLRYARNLVRGHRPRLQPGRTRRGLYELPLDDPPLGGDRRRNRRSPGGDHRLSARLRAGTPARRAHRPTPRVRSHAPRDAPSRRDPAGHGLHLRQLRHERHGDHGLDAFDDLCARTGVGGPDRLGGRRRSSRGDDAPRFRDLLCRDGLRAVDSTRLDPALRRATPQRSICLISCGAGATTATSFRTRITHKSAAFSYFGPGDHLRLRVGLRVRAVCVATIRAACASPPARAIC